MAHKILLTLVSFIVKVCCFIVLQVSLAAEEMKELHETNALVEEFMLLANISVAEEIFRKFPESSLLR